MCIISSYYLSLKTLLLPYKHVVVTADVKPPARLMLAKCLMWPQYYQGTFFWDWITTRPLIFTVNLSHRFLFKHHGRWMSSRAPPGSAARGLYPVVSVVEKFPVLAPTCTGKQKVCFLDCPSRQMFAQRVGECSAKQLGCSECRSAGLQDLGFVQKCAGGN